MSTDDFEKRKTIQFKRPKINTEQFDEDDETGEFDPSAVPPPAEEEEFDARKTGTFKRYDPDGDPA